MDLSPWVVGQLYPNGQISLVNAAGAPIDLSSATGVTWQFTNPASGATFTGAGTAAIASPATGGVTTYVWAASDVAVVGEFTIRVVASFPTGRPAYSDPVPFSVRSV